MGKAIEKSVHKKSAILVSRLALVAFLATHVAGAAPKGSVQDSPVGDLAEIDCDALDQQQKKKTGDLYEDAARDANDLFESTDCEIQRAFEALDKQIVEAFEEADRKIRGFWGDEAVMPTRDRWVGYSDDMKDRVIVDYSEGKITVQSVGDQDPERLKKVLEEVLNRSAADNTKNDPVVRELEKAPKKPKDPFDIDFDEEGFGDTSSEFGDLIDRKSVKVERYVRPVLRTEAINPPSPNVDGAKPRKRAQPTRKPAIVPAQKPNPPRQQVTVEFGDSWHEKNAAKYLDRVLEMSARYEIKPSLIFAIIHTESSFNPRARSGVPAYGLMQLVPTSGGLDAWRRLGRGDSAPDPDFLYDPLTNIELGATYFDMLMTRYLRRIDRFENRKLSSISAYNTGAGNVMRSFGKGTTITAGSKRINDMESEELFDHLVENLPYDETRRYLQKVTKHQKLYQKFDRL